MNNTLTLSRRSFLKVTSLAGGGLMLGFHATAAGDLLTDAAELFEPNAYVKISAEGVITILAPNPELGQGVRTTLPMIVAEELDVDWNTIAIEQTPLNTKLYERQVAGGSGAVRSSWDSFRKGGAAARQMLLEAAAKKWNVNVSECRTDKGFVLHPGSGKKASYGELASTAATLEIPKEIKLKEPADYKIIGTRQRSVDNKGIITGKAKYGFDIKREGMLYAMLARPTFGKKLKSFDDKAARAVNGVKNVVQHGSSIAVLATSTWAAKKGRDALKIEWEDEAPLESTSDYTQAFAKMIQQRSDAPKRNDGDVDQAFAGAAKILETTFEAPFLPHAPMEPMCYFADVRDDAANLFGPSQTPARTRSDVARAIGLAEDKITVGMSHQGGGFGRRLQADYSVEAAMVSKLAKAPVLVLWTREDDMQGGFYRPAGLYKYRAAISANKELIGWHMNAAATNTGNAARENSFPAGAVPNFRVDSHNHQSKITVGAWRAPNHNFIAYTEESFIDEIANELGKDPVAFRLELLERARKNPTGSVGYDVDKYIGVVKLAAEMGNWGKQGVNGIYKGFGAHYSFGTYVAQVADVSVIGNKIKVHKIYAAVDCGRVINPLGAEKQLEGGIIDGLGHALYGELTFDKGVVNQKNFNSYKMIRIQDTPDIEVRFIQSDAHPQGLGEPGLPPTGAAVANAIFAATGKRLKKQPFDLRVDIG